MSFSEAVRTCFRNYVTFSGRARRPEYWWFLLFVLVAGGVATLLDRALFGSVVLMESETVADGEAAASYFAVQRTGGPLTALVSLATVLPLLAAGWRRMHDVGRTGWWVFASAGGALIGGLLALPATFVSPVLAATLPMLLAAAGSFWSLWLLTRPGEPSSNIYGPEPAR